ncbi:hypothetical protein ILYODFUR_032249, partial [Ilyodon furcidens]
MESKTQTPDFHQLSVFITNHPFRSTSGGDRSLEHDWVAGSVSPSRLVVLCDRTSQKEEHLETDREMFIPAQDGRKILLSSCSLVVQWSGICAEGGEGSTELIEDICWWLEQLEVGHREAGAHLQESTNERRGTPWT